MPGTGTTAAAAHAEAGADAPEAARRGGGIQSLGRAFALMEEIARHADGSTLMELSRATGLHSSTVFHLLKTLEGLGYLRQDRATKRYRIGRGVFALAAACLDEREVEEAARPLVDELAARTGESAHFAVWSGDHVLILSRSSGRSAFQLDERAGMLRPAHCTAIGKALLCGLSDAELRRRLERTVLQRFTAKTLSDPEELARQIARAREDGVAYDDGEYNDEARCIAAPVRDFSGRVVGAIGFSGPVWRVSLSDLARHADATRDVAARLSAMLGG